MSATDELNKLKLLHDDGTITDEQYERARAKLLDPEAANEVGEERARRDEEDDDPPRHSARRKKINEWAMILHLSLFSGYVFPFGGIIVPIVLWQMKKDEWPEIDEHGKNAVNGIISFVIYMAISVVLCLVFIGFALVPVLGVLGVVFPIIAAVKANEGKVWRYPFTIRFLS